MKRFLAIILFISHLYLPVRAMDNDKLIALTFDDGPSGRYTEKLLNGLAERDVKATFLLCGYRMKQYPDLTQRIFLEGHEIGLHGYSHKTLQNTCRQGAELEIEKSMDLIPEGCKITFFRAPGGLCSSGVKEAAAQWGFSMLLWSVDPKDWAVHDVQTVSQSVISRVRAGDIILLHDMSDTSVDAAFTIIDQLQEEGYRFVTAAQLAIAKGVDLVPGAEYRRFGN